MRRAYFRARNELHLRKFSRPKQNLRLPIRQSHFATLDRTRTDEEITGDRQNAFASTVYFPQGQTIQSFARVDGQKGRRLRIRKARAKSEKRTKTERACS